EYGSDVWKDSCVEWFVQPGADTGYFNFEVNCCGTLLVSYNRIMVRDKARVKYSAPVLPDTGKQIKVFHSLSCPLKKEIIEPVRWIVELGVPLSFFEVFAGPLGKLQGSLWRANFNKCADESSQPHWATWSPVSEKNFHRPEDFGEMTFAGR
ncbi:MAG: carbohydrate-binding family 9-like protein, partial [Chitinispirillaceae bacterium]|nr:carbohydrate-binding family 9-like protein [Chitinispirillaceae bacterium]